MARADDWVVVEVARSEPDAELLCSVLRGAGVECLPRLTKCGAGAGDGLGTIGAHDIMVSPRDAQEAREILNEQGGEPMADTQETAPGRRWYHLRPEPRRRTDLMGFSSTLWMALGWLIVIVVIFFPFPWWGL